jgi:hypothetical protein
MVMLCKIRARRALACLIVGVWDEKSRAAKLV